MASSCWQRPTEDRERIERPRRGVVVAVERECGGRRVACDLGNRVVVGDALSPGSETRAYWRCSPPRGPGPRCRRPSGCSGCPWSSRGSRCTRAGCRAARRLPRRCAASRRTVAAIGLRSRVAAPPVGPGSRRAPARRRTRFRSRAPRTRATCPRSIGCAGSGAAGCRYRGSRSRNSLDLLMPIVSLMAPEPAAVDGGRE